MDLTWRIPDFLIFLKMGWFWQFLKMGWFCLYFHWATYVQSDCFCPVCHTCLQTISLIDITNFSPHRDLSLLLFSHPIMSNSLGPHGLQHARPPCSSPFPEVCPSSCPLHPWDDTAISSSHALLSFCHQAFPASGTFPMSRLFASVDQNIRASASASVLPMSVQGWFPLKLIGLILLLSKRFSGVFSNTTIQRHKFFGALLPLQTSSHNCTWPLGRTEPWLYGSLSAEHQSCFSLLFNIHFRNKNISVFFFFNI